MRRASQWLQYEGLRYAVEATLRARRGRRSRGSSTSRSRTRGAPRAVDYHGEPKPAYYGVARAYRGAPSAQFATCGVGRRRRGACACRRRRARFVDLDGTVVAEADGGELAAPLDAFAHDVFLLDLERAQPLRDDAHREPRAAARRCRRARVELARDGVAANCGDVAAIGVVLGIGRSTGRTSFSDNVLDLLPGEERELDGRAGELRVEGWNARRASALAPDGSPVDGFALRRALTVTLRRRRTRSTRASASSSSCRRPTTRNGSCPASSTARTAPRTARASTRASRPAASTSRGWSRTRGRSAPTAARRRPCSRAAAGSSRRETSPLGQSGVGFALPRRPPGDLARLPVPRGAAPLRRLRDAARRRTSRRYRWQPGERVELDVPRRATATGGASCAPRDTSAADDAAWVSVDGGGRARGVRALPLALPPGSAAADRDGRLRPRRRRRAGDRDAMHVSWVSGVAVRVRAAPPRAARRQRRSTSPRPRRCSTTSPATSRPAGRSGRSGRATAAGRGAGIPTTPARTRARSPTRRSSCSAPAAAGRRRRARTSTSRCRTQRDDGALPAAHHLETGDAVSWEGTAGMSWIPALVEAGHLEEAAPRRRVLPRGSTPGTARRRTSTSRRPPRTATRR